MFKMSCSEIHRSYKSKGFFFLQVGGLEEKTMISSVAVLVSSVTGILHLLVIQRNPQR